MVIKQDLANKANYGGGRPLSYIKYIVIHYTGNDGDSDESNGRYFHNNIVKASAHYFVDSDSITQAVPDDYVAWSVGGKFSTTNGAGSLYGKCTNSNSISIELCDNVKNGVIYPTAETIKNAVELVQALMKKYNVPIENVIRHYDVNGKQCPKYWVDNAKWQSEFKALLGSVKKAANPYKEPTTNIKKGSKGEGAKWVQWELNEEGYGLVVDGDFGTKSDTALRDFQKKRGLTVDGICGKGTRAKLKER